uniref:TolC family protein n=1 Tax=Acidobacterium capsulatum TaxID=33075 RepID=A0A7V5CSP1_9BACT
MDDQRHGTSGGHCFVKLSSLYVWILLAGSISAFWQLTVTAAAQTASAAMPANSTHAVPSAPQPAQQPASKAMTIEQQIHESAVGSYALPRENFHVEQPHSHNPFAAYMPSSVPPLDLGNSPRLKELEIGGKLYLSLREAIALAIEDNLDLAYFRYNLPIARTDLARTKAGGVANGVNVGVRQNTPGGNGQSFGSGSSAGSAGSSAGSAGASAGGAGGIVTSTLGEGSAVHSFDPQLSAIGFVDHTKTQLTNIVTTGTPVFDQNTVEGEAEYRQYFPLGTNIQFDYQGLRQTTNSLYNATNPTLESAFQFYVYQPLLQGFGLATNDRYIHIAKKNMQLTNLGFRAQVIATVTQVEDIYWDLVNAYEDEQVKENALQFAQKTLDDDKKQLKLQAIPEMQVLKDEADVAAREGDLTVARANLRLNELLIKNALTKTISDPNLVEMPVVPLTIETPSDPNADRPIDSLIKEAEKNRPDVTMDQLAMEIAQRSLKSIRNELLPSLSLYGEYAGVGNAGQPNPNCAGCETVPLPHSYGGSLQNAFNYSSPEYQAGFQLNITLRNRIAKADQFRAVLEYRQRQLAFEEQKKSILFDVRNSQYALRQAEARVTAAQQARDLAKKTFEITEQEQKLGAKSSYDTLAAQDALAVAQSALYDARAAYAKAQVDIDRATGETLDQVDISIDDAREGVVHNVQP